MNDRTTAISADKNTDQPPRLLESLTGLVGALCVAAIFQLTFSYVPPLIRQTSSVVGGLAPAEVPGCDLESGGFLQGELFGDLRVAMDWRGGALLCDGMTKSDGGIRLVFVHRPEKKRKGLVLVMGIRQLEPGQTGEGLVTNVTLIDEQQGRFYNAQGLERCWINVANQQPLPSSAAPVYRIDGELYCAGSIPEINGPGSVTLDNIRFSGRLTVEDS